MKSLEHNTLASGDALNALNEVHEALAAHQGFKETAVSAVAAPPRRSLLGRIIKRLRFRKFGAEFEGGLSLINFQVRKEAPRIWILELQWHVTRIIDGISVFVHFVDSTGNIGFQGDYPLDNEAPDALGFFYSRRRVDVPREASAGIYRVRLGVWRPLEKKHLNLLVFRGCLRETVGWACNAVILNAVELLEQNGAAEQNR